MNYCYGYFDSYFYYSKVTLKNKNKQKTDPIALVYVSSLTPMDIDISLFSEICSLFL